MTAQHTPGPWTRNGRAIEQARAEGLTTVIAWLEEEDIGDVSEVNANGSLLIAAPELLESALAVVRAGWASSAIPRDLLSSLEAAIAKAEGNPRRPPQTSWARQT